MDSIIRKITQDPHAGECVIPQKPRDNKIASSADHQLRGYCKRSSVMRVTITTTQSTSKNHRLNMRIASLLLLPAAALAFTPSPQHSSSPITAMSAQLAKEGDSSKTSRRYFLGAGAVAALSIATSAFPGVVPPAFAAAVATTTPSSSVVGVGGRVVYGADSIMDPKAHGTSNLPVQDDLLYGVSKKLADRICNFNRHFAESGGYFQSTNWQETVLEAKGQPVTFYDSVTGKPLFVAPIGRTPEDLIQESVTHGWPSFRDQEVVWENVRVLRSSGETVSADGTHLGHNLPDRRGNRYCINLVSIAGRPTTIAA